MTTRRVFKQTIRFAAILLLLLVCCSHDVPDESRPPQKAEAAAVPAVVATQTPDATPGDGSSAEGLSAEQLASLNSLEQVDDYPLYVMHFSGGYAAAASRTSVSPGKETSPRPSLAPTWACSLFAALADSRQSLFGRNFDWEFSPAMLLFTAPPDGYASVSMVDIAYLGFGDGEASRLTDLPIVERQALLDAPLLPFDGMNEHGLVVAMAAVPPGSMKPDPEKMTIGSLRVIREMLDRANNVQQAVDILQNYNIDWQGGPPLHYLVADASGRAALIEFFQGKLVVIPNDAPWHLASNFLRAAAGQSAQGRCQRYDTIVERLTEASGILTTEDAMALLEDVAQAGTQWSVVYEISSGHVNVAMGRAYGDIYTFALDSSAR